jgi:hypothetical protein
MFSKSLTNHSEQCANPTIVSGDKAHPEPPASPQRSIVQGTLVIAVVFYHMVGLIQTSMIPSPPTPHPTQWHVQSIDRGVARSDQIPSSDFQGRAQYSAEPK